MNETKQLRVLFYREGEDWIAQCIDHDVCASGRSLEEANRAFGQQLSAEVHLNFTRGRSPFDIPKAPAEFAARFDQETEKLEARELDLGPAVPAPHILRAVADRRISA